jgi:hypothetical protein
MTGVLTAITSTASVARDRPLLLDNRCGTRPARADGPSGPGISAAGLGLQHITASPSRIGDIARAALVLTHFEHGYIK